MNGFSKMGLQPSQHVTPSSPSSSPDLSLLDYFRCGFVKFRASQLKNEVRKVFEFINVNTLQYVIANFVVRIDKCIVSGGSHFES